MKVEAPTPHGLAAAPDALVVGVDFADHERLDRGRRRSARRAFVPPTATPSILSRTVLMAGAGSLVAAVVVASGREPTSSSASRSRPVRDRGELAGMASARRGRRRRRPRDGHPRRERGRGALGADADRRHLRRRPGAGARPPDARRPRRRGARAALPSSGGHATLSTRGMSHPGLTGESRSTDLRPATARTRRNPRIRR
jgi:hypothetical protein